MLQKFICLVAVTSLVPLASYADESVKADDKAMIPQTEVEGQSLACSGCRSGRDNNEAEEEVLLKEETSQLLAGCGCKKRDDNNNNETEEEVVLKEKTAQLLAGCKCGKKKKDKESDDEEEIIDEEDKSELAHHDGEHNDEEEVKLAACPGKCVPPQVNEEEEETKLAACPKCVPPNKHEGDDEDEEQVEEEEKKIA